MKGASNWNGTCVSREIGIASSRQIPAPITFAIASDQITE